MYTISNDYAYELIIRNSRFITLLYKLDSDSNIERILDDVKKEYADATHYCYAYINGDTKKSSDDGEPSGTAGIPILKVLEKNNLNYILVVIVRYFGGIKLGANGLIRAYTKCAANSLKEITFKELSDGVNVDIYFDYDKVKDVDYLLRDIRINNKSFTNRIRYNIDIPLDLLIKIQNSNIDCIINKEIKIEK